MLNVVLKIISLPFKLIAYILIYLYKFLISPILPKTCIFYPSCSTYMLQAIKEFGFINGLILGTKRLLRCTPKNKGGEDYVPVNIKGDKKWIF